MDDNVVYLLVGQRGSGKSQYAESIVKAQPGVSVVSRDEILIRLFGSVHTSPYSGAPYIAYEVMERLLRRKLSTQSGLRLILDSWTGDKSERRSLIKKLKQYGADRVVAFYFVTPLELVNEWFWKKPGIAKVGDMERLERDGGYVFFLEDAPAEDHKMFHRAASHIDSDGFDQVIRIDPRERPITVA